MGFFQPEHALSVSAFDKKIIKFEQIEHNCCRRQASSHLIQYRDSMMDGEPSPVSDLDSATNPDASPMGLFPGRQTSCKPTVRGLKQHCLYRLRWMEFSHFCLETERICRNASAPGECREGPLLSLYLLFYH